MEKCKDFSYTEKGGPIRNRSGVEKLSQSGDSVAGYFCRWTQCLTLGLLLRFQPGGGEYDQHYCAFWALCVVCIVNMARYFSSLRALLAVLRGCDPLLYQYVDGAGFFTSHGQPSKQVRLVTYIWAKRYLDHHDDEFIRRCERVRGQFMLTSALCGLVVISLVALAIWH